jgi:hypothetical protein
VPQNLLHRLLGLLCFRFIWIERDCRFKFLPCLIQFRVVYHFIDLVDAAQCSFAFFSNHDCSIGVVDLSLLAGIEVFFGVESAADARHGDFKDMLPESSISYSHSRSAPAWNHAVIEVGAGNLQDADWEIVI